MFFIWFPFKTVHKEVPSNKDTPYMSDGFDVKHGTAAWRGFGHGAHEGEAAEVAGAAHLGTSARPPTASDGNEG